MTISTQKSRGQFLSLKTTVMNALFTISDHEFKALASGDEELADELFEKRVALQNEVIAIRKAEIAYLSSDKGVTEAEAALIEAANIARRSLRRLKKLNTALESASKLVKLLTRLVNSVK